MAKQVGEIMKKFKFMILIGMVLLVLGIVSYFVFYSRSNSNMKGDIKNDIKDNIKLETGVYSNKNWDEKMETANLDCVPDKDTAIKIANVITNRYTKGRAYGKYEITSVFYDNQDGVWIVSYDDIPADKNMKVVGGCYNIAIRKKDAKVLRIWGDE